MSERGEHPSGGGRHQHRDLAAGRWRELTLCAQLGHIGSEVSRALNWRTRNPEVSRGALVRALELFDLTLADPRHLARPARLRELARAREVLADFLAGENRYRSTEEDLRRYFDTFAGAAARGR
jgi:hypothetical protein